MSKFKISVIDFIPETGRHPIGEVDSNGEAITVGDIVTLNGEKHMVAYRYGDFVLKQPMTMHTLGISDWSKTTKLNEIWSTPDNIACGDISEAFYNRVKHLCV